MNIMRRSVATAAVAGTLLAGGMAAPAYADHTLVHQDGLVNVAIGDVTVLQDVNVAVAANVVAALCGIPVTVGVLSSIDDGVTQTFNCETRNRGRAQEIVVTQN